MADFKGFDGVPVLDGAASRHRLLVVDASPAHLGVLERRLSEAGHAVAIADSAERARNLLQLERPELMLLDWGLPRGAAVDLLRMIRDDRRLADLPVIAVTARSDNSAAVAALATGADDYVGKPYDFDLLLARVRRLLSRSATVANLRRANAALDARVVSRAIEIGELRDRLEASLDESRRLEASIRQLERELRRGEAGQPVAGAQPRV